MSRRFLAARSGEETAAPGLDTWRSHQIADVRILVSPAMPVLAFRDELMIIGDLFGPDHRPIRSLETGLALSIIASDGRWLADKGWGRFAAFWKDRRGAGVWIYRDPSGHIPVHLVDDGASPLAFSDLDDAQALARRTLSVDWQNLAHRLVYTQLQTRRTALEHVGELLPGEAALLGQGRRQQLWSPWTFAPSARDREARSKPDPAALKSTIVQTVGALTADKNRALLELSGGLDSSILAASLARSGARWMPINVVTPGAGGDEREWATPVAALLGAELQTVIVAADTHDLFAVPPRLTPSPGGFGMLRPTDRAVSGRADALRADAIVSGTGGDNVFCSLRSAAPVIDGWRLFGPAGAYRAARDLGHLTQTGFWEIARQTRSYMKRERRDPKRWRANHDLLSADCRPDFAGHPWLDAPLGRLAGSRAQIVLLLRAHGVISAHDRTRVHDMIFPLLAQPIVEMCLKIPSPYWIAGGQDRSVAREAFRESLPANTIARRSKGRRDGLVARTFDRHRRAIEARLLEGELVAMGLIDRAAIQSVATRPAGFDDLYMRMLELLDAELWLSAVRR